MIPIAKNIEEATRHFLNNTGPIACERKKETKTCSSLKEANDFFSRHIQKVRNKVRPIK